MLSSTLQWHLWVNSRFTVAVNIEFIFNIYYHYYSFSSFIVPLHILFSLCFTQSRMHAPYSFVCKHTSCSFRFFFSPFHFWVCKHRKYTIQSALKIMHKQLISHLLQSNRNWTNRIPYNIQSTMININLIFDFYFHSSPTSSQVCECVLYVLCTLYCLFWISIRSHSTDIIVSFIQRYLCRHKYSNENLLLQQQESFICQSKVSYFYTSFTVFVVRCTMCT